MKTAAVKCHHMLVAGVLLALLTACANDGTGDGGEPPSISAAEAEEQYFGEAAMWELPQKWSWPEGPVYAEVADDGHAIFYGPDAGRIDATSYWFCAWSRALIEAETDADREFAREQVLRLPETPAYQRGMQLPDTREYYDEMLAEVEAGDYSRLARDTELNCPESPR